MVIKRTLFSLLLISLMPLLGNAQQANTDRVIWLQYLEKVTRPVLENLAKDQLKENMIVELAPNIDNASHRTHVAYLEAFGRTLSGIAPWLDLKGGNKQEVELRNQYRTWALKAISNSVNPKANDYLLWKGGQPLLDASFFALGLIRSPWLWENLSKEDQDNVVSALLQTRDFVPVYSNWILFSAMIETFFCKYGMPYDKIRIEYALRTFSEHWYTGDGMYADGMDFRMDYYNSYVIQPYIQAIIGVMGDKGMHYDYISKDFKKISERYAEIQERFINTDGTFPVMGRSIVYRGGVFHHLADVALRKKLPSTLQPAQIRGALTAVIKKTSESSNTFTKEGWLTIGLYGKTAFIK